MGVPATVNGPAHPASGPSSPRREHLHVAQATRDSTARLRDGWEQQWLRVSSVEGTERSALLDLHAALHAASQLAEAALEPSADLIELLVVHDGFGRTASSQLAGEIALTAQIVQRIDPSTASGGMTLPVMAAAGDRPLRVERSRPDWHLNGTVRGVAWSHGAERLAVFAIDEGDNDVLALVAPDAPRVEVTVRAASGSGRELADIHFDDVTLPDVAHCPGEPAALADGLTVLALADVIGAAGSLLEHPETHAELQLCRATLRAAAASLTSASVVRRQHDVSAAAVLVLPTCLRLAAEAPGQDDPDVFRRVQRVREHVLALPAWHRDRLLALV